MKKLNMSVLSKLNNTFASLRYCGEVKCVKKASLSEENLPALAMFFNAILAHAFLSP